MDFVKQYFTMKARVKALTSELAVAKRLMADAENQLQYDGIIKGEYLTWTTDDLPY